MTKFDRFTEKVAPKSRLDFWLRWASAIFGLNVINSIYDYVVITRVWNEPYVWETDIMITLFITITCVTGPLIALGLLIIGRQRRLQHEMAYLAATDVLTGLRNRRAFFRDAGDLIKARQNCLLILLDADHFKRINDTYGHDVGDLCLRTIADRIVDHCRQGDVSGRIGGEEFAILLRDAGEEALEIGRKLCWPAGHQVAQMEGLVVTLSGGATPMSVLDDVAGALTRADAALYLAKANGRAQLQVTTDMQSVKSSKSA